MIFDKASVSTIFTSSRWQGLLGCALSYRSSVCKCDHFCVLRCTVFGTEKWSSTSGFSKLFYLEAPEPFLCPLLQSNSVGGWRQTLFPGLSEPSSPVVHTLAVVHLIYSLAISTCAPGAVPQPTIAAPWRTALWCSTRQCWATACIDKHLQ
jgi:hypothetical protein